MLYPLNAWSIKSMSRMQEVGPKIKAVQERYKKDPKRSQIEVMKIYKEQGVNPMGGCLPMIIQLPFLIGMFDLIKSSFDLRGAVFIPGWINNLTSPDVIFSWNYPIFFIGTELHLLPLLLGVAMWLQPKLSSKTPKDKSLLTDQQKQQRNMGNIMAIVFTFLFYNFPSGLNIYWLSSSILGIIQQWYMTKKTKTN
jgi:YidC/Oxa1 family membrane protein insertase